MQRRSTLGRPLARRHAVFLAGAAALVVAGALPAIAAGALKLPTERTSPTGNYFTLEAYVAPTASKRIANFEMKVCTSKHTPADTAIDPALFTLSLTHGGTAAESVAVAKSPAMVLKPLKPLECTEGWLGFSVPNGKSVSTLEYDYNGKISWAVG
jgi:hypothetical protein